jgi:hypothetical protein
MNTARIDLAGVGIQTAALGFAGLLQLIQEQQKNTMVIVGQLPGSLNTARRNLGGAGIQTAALAFGGATSSSLWQQQKNTMEQVGTSVNPLNTARYSLGGVGTQTAALAFGGATPPRFRSNRRIQWYIVGQQVLQV